jgi:hypothetical protein
MATSMTSPPQQGYASPVPPVSYEAVAAQAADYNSTVYVGNLIPYTTQADLVPLFQGYGYIVEIRMQADRGFAFVKLDSHHNAAMAITQLQNRLVHGRPIKCSWGKDKDAGAAPTAGAPPAQQYPQVSRLVVALTSNAKGQQQQLGYGAGYGYYGGYYGQTGVPGQPGQPAQHAPQDGSNGQWDPAAAQAYYQSAGWGDYYSESGREGDWVDVFANGQTNNKVLQRIRWHVYTECSHCEGFGRWQRCILLTWNLSLACTIHTNRVVTSTFRFTSVRSALDKLFPSSLLSCFPLL